MLLIFSKLYRFYVTIYDVAFLGILFTGLNFTLLLWFTKKARQSANRFLAMALAVVILWIVGILGIDLGIVDYIHFWHWLPLQFSLALGPLIFFYVLKTTRPAFNFRTKDLLHFSSVLLELGAQILEACEGKVTGLSARGAFVSGQLMPALQVLAFISVVIYLHQCRKLIENFYQRLKFDRGDRRRYELRWLNKILTVFGLLTLTGLTVTALNYFQVSTLFLQAYHPLYLLLAVTMICLAANAFLRAESNEPAAHPLLKPIISEDLKQKGTWLKKAIKEHRYYQDPDLSLKTLAERLDMHTHELSRILNTVLKKSFNDFINEYRVQAVVQKMHDPDYDHITMLGIAVESGFNSQSTFSRIFKQMTGRTPLEYKNDLKKDFPSYNLRRKYGIMPIKLHNEGPFKWSEAKSNGSYMFKNYFKIAWRNIMRHKLITTINVAGLSVGMTAAVLISLWVQNELSFDKNQPDSENIYRITADVSITKTETWKWEHSQYVLGEHAMKELPEVVDMTRLKSQKDYAFNMRYNGELISEKGSAYVDDQWFKMFHYDVLAGSVQSFLKNPFSLILTESTAKRYFGDQPAVGKVLRADTVDYQVQAVVKDNPANSSFQFNVLIPLAAQLTNPSTKKNALTWNNYNYITFLKLRPDANPKKVADKLLYILKTNRKDFNGKSKYRLVNLRDMHFENDLQSSAFTHGSRSMVDIFMILAGLLLITACINYVNLTTARASVRSKEVSIKKIVGARRRQLFLQFMAESFLISLLALVMCVLLMECSLPWFRSFTGVEFSGLLSSATSWAIILSTLIVSLVLNGLYPATLLSSFNPMSVFRGKTFLSFKDTGLRKALVVVQFTISVILIVGTLVISFQLRYIEKIDLGYDRSQVFSFSFPWWKIKGFDSKKSDELLRTVKNELKKQSAVADIAIASTDLVDFGSSSSGYFDWAGRPKDFEPSFAPLDADQDFQRLMHLQVKEGRWINSEDVAHNNVVLNETALELTHLRKPFIGQRFVHQGDTGTVVGIVKDFHYRNLHDKIGPMVISARAGDGFYIKTAPGNSQAAIEAVQKVWKKFFPDAPLEYSFLDDKYNSLYKTEQQSFELVTLFAGIAILVSALGLLGLAAFAAEQKVKEIGIRKVLGANVRHIVSLLTADFLKMVVVASLIAFPIAWWAMNKWLQAFAYRIHLSWWIFILAAAIAVIIAIITISTQTIKAALANPVRSLRNE